MIVVVVRVEEIITGIVEFPEGAEVAEQWVVFQQDVEGSTADFLITETMPMYSREKFMAMRAAAADRASNYPTRGADVDSETGAG